MKASCYFLINFPSCAVLLFLSSSIACYLIDSCKTQLSLVLSFLDPMPPKPTNPTPKELDEAIQSTNQRLHELIQTNQQNLQAAIRASTRTFKMRLDNQDVIMDSWFETLTAMIKKKFAALNSSSTSNNPSSSTSNNILFSPGPNNVSLQTEPHSFHPYRSHFPKTLPTHALANPLSTPPPTHLHLLSQSLQLRTLPHLKTCIHKHPIISTQKHHMVNKLHNTTPRLLHLTTHLLNHPPPHHNHRFEAQRLNSAVLMVPTLLCNIPFSQYTNILKT